MSQHLQATLDILNWAIPENIHTPPMDDIGNPVRNAQ